MNFHARNSLFGRGSANIYKPSLEVGLLRPDPWNEFIARPIRESDLLEFNSLRDSEISRLNAQIRANLTVVMGVKNCISTDSLPASIPVVELPVAAPTPQKDVSVVSKAIPPVTQTALPSESASVSPAEPAPPSIWARMTGIMDTLRKTSISALPDWFASETSLITPTDVEIRARLGSIYGGDLTQVRISIRVLEAVDVPVADWWGTSDPYVAVALVRGVGGLSSGRLELLPTIGNQKFSTTRFGQLNPKWNETIVMDLADLLTVISDSVLHVSLWDKDILKADNPMGYSALSLVDCMQTSGISPYPLIPIQTVGSLVGPHTGLFVKISLRMVKKVGVVSVTPIALQGFSNGWKNYSIRVEAKVVESDPIAASSYMSSGLCRPETSIGAKVNETGHAIWPKELAPVTLLFSCSKKSKPYLHLTLKSDGTGIGSDPGQIAVRMGLLEKLAGVSPMRLQPLVGSPPGDVLEKCALYCGVECELVQ